MAAVARILSATLLTLSLLRGHGGEHISTFAAMVSATVGIERLRLAFLKEARELLAFEPIVPVAVWHQVVESKLINQEVVVTSAYSDTVEAEFH